MGVKNFFRGLSFFFMFSALITLFFGDAVLSPTLAVGAVWAEVIAWRQDS